MAKRNKKTKVSRTNPPQKVKRKPAPKISEPWPLKWKMLIAAGMALLAMLVYAPSYNYDFVYDDDAVVKENRFVQQGLAGLDEIWTTSYFEGYSENIKARAYRPIPLTTLAIEYELFGLDSKANHISNILMYGLTGFLLFLFLATLLRNYHPALPVIVSLLFVLHPIHIEVVANIKSRDTMLGFIGFLSGALLFLKYFDRRKIGLLAMAALFYGIGLFSKESALTNLAVFPLLLWFFRKTSLVKSLTYSLPLIAMGLIYLGIRSSILGGLNEGVTLTPLDNSLLAAETLDQRIASNILVLGVYLFKTIFPHPLLSDYSYLTIPLVGWDDWRVYASLLANLGLLYVGFMGFVRRKIYGFGALQYFITVSIFTSIIITNVSAYNDRFLYEPVLGICILIGWLISRLIKAPADRQYNVAKFFKNNFVPVAITVLLATLELVKIENHLPVWKDRYVLFEHDVKLAPDNARMRKNHGGSLARKAVEYQQTDIAKAREYAQQAIEELKKALAIYEDIPTGHIHLGNMYIIMGDYSNAERSLLKALEYAPENYFARSSLANVYYRLGRYNECINMLDTISRTYLKPNDYYLYSLAYSKIGDEAKAAEYRKLSGR